VTLGPQDPLLGALRQAHALPPREQITDKLRLYRVQIAAPPCPSSLVTTSSWLCPQAVLLDTLP
jgi:hypothetical protein